MNKLKLNDIDSIFIENILNATIRHEEKLNSENGDDVGVAERRSASLFRGQTTVHYVTIVGVTWA